MDGWLGIFDLKKYQTLKNIEFMSVSIHSVAFLRDNKSAFISDWSGYIKMIKWKADANSGDDFDFTGEHKKVGHGQTFPICLTKDDKYLLVGSYRLVSVFETTTRKVIKEIKMQGYVRGISLIKDDRKAIIVDMDGRLSILDLETLQKKYIVKDITNGKGLSRIIVI